MIPKLHAKGTSFKGAAAYLLHDKDAATSGRVGWVEMVNLSTRNPETAWRVMAATALDAGRLKEQAGVKKTGRSSRDTVLHLTLSWGPEQKPDRQEMSAFARRAIEALKAGDRQAMIICHSDEKHPHVHILLNRVSPQDGRMLSSSNEKNALSALALAYERESGEILCKQREANAAKRAEGEYIRGEKDVPRPEFEAMRDEQRKVEQAIPAQVVQQHPNLLYQARATFKQQWRDKLDSFKAELRAGWRDLYQRHRAEAAPAQESQGAFFGRLREWFTGGRRQNSPALPFQKASLAHAVSADSGQQQEHRIERVRFAARHRPDLRKMAGDMRPHYEGLLRQVMIGYGVTLPQNPPAGGQSPSPLTVVQGRISELAEKFRSGGRAPEQKPANPAPRLPRDKEREWEP